MYFHETSVELKISVAIAGLLPCIIAYAIMFLRRNRERDFELSFSAAISVAGAFTFSYFAISFLFFNWDYLQRGLVTFDRMLVTSWLATAAALPGLLLTVVFSLAAITCWMSVGGRWLFISFSVLAQVFFAINLPLFLLGFDLFRG